MKNKSLIILIYILFPVVLISFVGCPGTKRDELKFYRSKVDSLRTLVNKFIVDYNKLKYESYLEKQPFLIVNLYQRYGQLFNQEDINLINNLLKLEQRPERIERLERLKVFIYEKIVEKQTAGIRDRIEIVKYYINYPSKIGNAKYDELDRILSIESNQKKRKFLYNAYERFLSDLKSVNLKLLKERREIIVDSLHFNSYKQFASMIRQEDLDKFYQTVQNFISSTNDFYFQQLYELLRIKRLSQDRPFAYDLPFIVGDPKLSKFFKGDSIKTIFTRTYYNTGFFIDSLPNLKINYLSSRNKKSKELDQLKTSSFEILIPDENYLYINQSDGCENYEAIFSESAKLFPSIFSTESLFEFNYLGGDGIPLTFKNLFSNLMDESEFLTSNIFKSNRLTSEFLRLRAFKKLYAVRKLCADFIVEYLFIDSIQTNSDSLLQIYSSILGYNISSGDKMRLFSTINDYYQEAELLNSIFIEAMMKTKIRDKFGINWYNVPQLKDYLLKFIKRGRFLTKDKFLVEIGYYDLDPRFFFNEIISMKEKSKTIRQR